MTTRQRGRAPSRSDHPGTARLATAERLVGSISWVVFLSGAAAVQISEQASYQTGQALLLATMAIFFPLLILRAVLASRLASTRRLPLTLLALTMTLWALGSISINAGSLTERTTFPADGEWLFALSYLSLAGFLLSDVTWKRRPRARTWLDVAVACGVASCLASLAMITPVRLTSDQEGLTLLLGVMYPLADVFLALIVAGQVVVRMRTDIRATTMLVGGLVILALADSAFLIQVSAPTYDFAATSNILWGAAWALIVAGACRSTVSEIPVAPREVGTPLLIGAALIALAELTIRPDQTLAYYTVPPAILTMIAIIARMALALRDATSANEAITLAKTDDLTRLPNRRAIRVKVTEALEQRQRLSLMLLDLDSFKEVNDSLGHHAGDMVLSFVSAQMRDSLDSAVFVARLGGDEFAILFADTDEVTLVETAHAILAAVATPMVVDGIELVPSGSIGITSVRDVDTPMSADEVLRRADVAMYQAKHSRSKVALYDPQLDEFSRTRLEIAEELRKGVASQQIEVWYQPQINARTMEVYGIEAMVRWRHPTRGLLSPIAFLPTARRVGLMGLLSESIAWQAAADLRTLLDAGWDLQLSLNCSPPELLSTHYLPRLFDILDERQIDASRVILEVTEESFLAEPHCARDILLDVSRRGMHVSIDDYGTGFSSLTYLRNLPVDELKLDRSLISDVADNDRSRMIVASTIQLAHALDMRTVAEGVEDARTLQELAQMGIDCLQGYHLARPMPAAELAGWLREWNTAARVEGSRRWSTV